MFSYFEKLFKTFTYRNATDETITLLASLITVILEFALIYTIFLLIKKRKALTVDHQSNVEDGKY